MRSATYITDEKRAEQAKLAADVDAYVAAGGTIEKLGDTPLRFNSVVGAAPSYARQTKKRGPKPKAQKEAEAKRTDDDFEDE